MVWKPGIVEEQPHVSEYPVMVYVEGIEDHVSAYLRPTSLEPLGIVHATVDWYGAAPMPSSLIRAQGGETEWEQLSLLIAGAFGAPSACVVPALRAQSWSMARLFLHFSTQKTSQTVQIAMFRKDWKAEFWFPGTRRNREDIEIADEYRHQDVGELLASLMLNYLSFKLFL